MSDERKLGRRLTDQASYQLHQSAVILKLLSDLKRAKEVCGSASLSDSWVVGYQEAVIDGTIDRLQELVDHMGRGKNPEVLEVVGP